MKFTLLVLLLTSVTVAQTPKDTVVKKSGEKVRGVEIVAMTTKTITYKRGGTEFQVPATDLRGIDWRDPPKSMELGTAAMDRGEFENAANFYQEAAGQAATDDRKALAAECVFLAARALALGIGAESGKASAAKQALQSYVDANGDGFRIPEARLLLGRATQIAGDASAAEAIFKEVEDAALNQGWGLIWDARAKFEKAQALASQGKFAEARTAYSAAQSVVQAAASNATEADAREMKSLEMLALVGQGECLIREGKFLEAQSFFGNLASGAGEEFRAAALAGEGQALFLQAGENDVARLRQAQIKLAEAVILDATDGDTTAKAQFLLGKTLLKLGPENESSDFRTRAHAYFDSVIRLHGNSQWATAARMEMQK